jgi:hypothetical protein
MRQRFSKIQMIMLKSVVLAALPITEDLDL